MKHSYRRRFYNQSYLLSRVISDTIFTIQLTLRAVAFTALTVTFPGGTEGAACNVLNSLVGKLGSLLPTIFTAINLRRYLAYGFRFST